MRGVVVKRLTREQAEEIVRKARERGEEPDLTEANLSGVNLSGADLSGANLWGATLNGADLSGANLSGALLDNVAMRWADLSGADLSEAEMEDAKLIDTNLNQANLEKINLYATDLHRANLEGANLSEAALYWVNLSGADLSGANLSGAKIGSTIFTDVDLSEVKGLETVKHSGLSYIDIHTLYHSKGKIPPIFLEGAGISPDFIKEIEPQLHEQGKYLSAKLRTLQKQLTSTSRNIGRLKEQITQQGGEIAADIGKLNQLDENEKEAETLEIEIEEIKAKLANLSKPRKDPPQ